MSVNFNNRELNLNATPTQRTKINRFGKKQPKSITAKFDSAKEPQGAKIRRFGRKQPKSIAAKFDSVKEPQGAKIRRLGRKQPKSIAAKFDSAKEPQRTKISFGKKQPKSIAAKFDSVKESQGAKINRFGEKQPTSAVINSKPVKNFDIYSGSAEFGLNAAQAEASRLAHGSNLLTQKKRKTFFRKLLENFGDPMIKVLLFALAINIVFLFGQSNWFESLGIAAAVLIAILVSTISEHGSESAFKKLQEETLNISVRVRRDGKTVFLPIAELVAGDIVLLGAGDRIPADGEIISGKLEVNQASLNGESKEVIKESGHTQNSFGAAQRNGGGQAAGVAAQGSGGGQTAGVAAAQGSGKNDFLNPVLLFSGTVVTGGEGVMRVTAVGDNTFYGKLAFEIQEETPPSPLKVKLGVLAKKISHYGYLGAGFVAFSYLFNALLIKNMFDGARILADITNWRIILTYFLSAATLAVTVMVMAIPEGLPMMITVVLSSNMRRMLKDNVLVRKLNGIETAGSMNILFTDKTGTLTKGKLEAVNFVDGNGKIYDVSELIKQSAVARSYGGISGGMSGGYSGGAGGGVGSGIGGGAGGGYGGGVGNGTGGGVGNGIGSGIGSGVGGGIGGGVGSGIGNGIGGGYGGGIGHGTGGGLRDILEYSLLYNTGAEMIDGKAGGGNATDRALLEFAQKLQKEKNTSVKKISVVPFSSDKKYMSTVISYGGKKFTLIKGAPEKILEQCNRCYSENGQAVGFSGKGAVVRAIKSLSEKAIRVIAVAVSEGELTADKPLQNLVFVGLIGIRDQTRREAVKGIRLIREAGIQTVMITGDSKITAAAVAAETGILYDNGLVITSEEMSKMSDETLKSKLPSLRVVARALPSDKSRLVRIAQSLNLVAGMTGDGVNDAPALKKADIGFAMGSGTEVAKEAGDVVILDDNILSVARAVSYGRTIFKSIRKFIIFQLTINFCAMAISMIAPLLNVEMPITVIQMLWINLVIDTLAGLAFGGERARAKYMSEPPKRRDEPIISRYMWQQIIFSSVYIAVVSLWFLKSGFVAGAFDDKGKPYAMTAFFTLFMFMAVFNSLNARTHELNLFSYLALNKPFILIMSSIAVIQILLVYFGGNIFHTVPLTFKHLSLIILFAFSIVPVDMIRKLFVRKRGSLYGT